MASSTVSAFTTDWDNIGRFVLETASQGTIPNTTREYLKQRLVSSEDHIVLITLSVLDSFVINCGRSVRDELAAPSWMKILLNSFVTNLPKKHIRNAMQQMFSNWRHLLQGELLGREAHNVCKHMQSKNYVVPPPMTYAPEAVAAVARGLPATDFIQGTDFYSIASTPHSSASSPRAALRAATGPPTDAAEVKLARMDHDRTKLAEATRACRDAAELLRHGANSERLRQAESRVARGQECAAQCRSWSDAVQKMVLEGASEALIGRALETNEMMCATLDSWDAACASATALMAEASSALSPRHVPELLDVASPASQPPSHPVDDVCASSPREAAPPPPTTAPRSSTSNNNPFSSNTSNNNPFSSTNDLMMLQPPDVGALQQEMQALRVALEEAKAQHAQQLAAVRSEHEGAASTMRAQVSALRAQLVDERRRAEEGTRRIAELAAALEDARSAKDALQARVRYASASAHVTTQCTHLCLRELDQASSTQQQQVQVLQAQLHEQEQPEPRSHSAVEWRLLKGASKPSFSSTRGGSRRALAHADSFSTARDAVPQGQAAELLAAYRRMPALRVRLTPQHFASLVTTVSETW